MFSANKSDTLDKTDSLQQKSRTISAVFSGKLWSHYIFFFFYTNVRGLDNSFYFFFLTLSMVISSLAENG